MLLHSCDESDSTIFCNFASHGEALSSPLWPGRTICFSLDFVFDRTLNLRKTDRMFAVIVLCCLAFQEIVTSLLVENGDKSLQVSAARAPAAAPAGPWRNNNNSISTGGAVATNGGPSLPCWAVADSGGGFNGTGRRSRGRDPGRGSAGTMGCGSARGGSFWATSSLGAGSESSRRRLAVPGGAGAGRTGAKNVRGWESPLYGESDACAKRGGGRGSIRRVWSDCKGVPLASGAGRTGLSESARAATLDVPVSSVIADPNRAAKVGKTGTGIHNDDDDGASPTAVVPLLAAAKAGTMTPVGVAPAACDASRCSGETKDAAERGLSSNGTAPASASAAAAVEGSPVPPPTSEGLLPRDPGPQRRGGGSSSSGTVVTPPRSAGGEAPTNVTPSCCSLPETCPKSMARGEATTKSVGEGTACGVDNKRAGVDQYGIAEDGTGRAIAKTVAAASMQKKSSLRAPSAHQRAGESMAEVAGKRAECSQFAGGNRRPMTKGIYDRPVLRTRAASKERRLANGSHRNAASVGGVIPATREIAIAEPPAGLEGSPPLRGNDPSKGAGCLVSMAAVGETQVELRSVPAVVEPVSKPAAAMAPGALPVVGIVPAPGPLPAVGIVEAPGSIPVRSVVAAPRPLPRPLPGTLPAVGIVRAPGALPAVGIVAAPGPSPAVGNVEMPSSMPGPRVANVPGPMPAVGIVEPTGLMPAVGVVEAPGPMPAVGIVEAPWLGHPYRGSGINSNGRYCGPSLTVRQQPLPHHHAPTASRFYRPGSAAFTGGSSAGSNGIMGDRNGGGVDEVSLRLVAVTEALSLLEDVAILPRLYSVANAVQVEVDGRAEMQAKIKAAIRIERVSDDSYRSRGWLCLWSVFALCS